MKKNPLVVKCFTIVASFALCASAQAIVVLDFEGIGNLEPVGDFYNGDGGPDYDISFSDNALAIVDQDAGGSGNFGGEPSPSTVLFFLTGSAATLNYGPGFQTGFSFYYSSINFTGSVSVWDDLDGTGNLLATIDLPLTTHTGAPDPTGQFSPLVPVGVKFGGTARSIDFSGSIDQIAFDNITFGSEAPRSGSGGTYSVPDTGTTLSLLGAGLLAVAVVRRRF